MHPRKKTIKELEKNGFIFKRHGASHDFNESDMRYILKEANIEGGK